MSETCKKASDRTLVAPDQGCEQSLLQPQSLEVNFESKKHLSKLLKANRLVCLHVLVDDVVDVIAELKEIGRDMVLKDVLSSWFRSATNFNVIEIGFKEQEAAREGALMEFQVRLDGQYEREVSKLAKGEDLAGKLRSKLLDSLPRDFIKQYFKDDEEALKQQIHISWTRPGSIELGGTVALSLLVLIIISTGLARCSCKCCECDTLCSCVGQRVGHGGSASYDCAMSDLRQRGAEFELHPDGRTVLRVPPAQRSSWMVPGCTLM